MSSEEPFEVAVTERSVGGSSLVVDVDGFEGPLDLLLLLARQQNVDLAKISILALADQYLAFVEQARETPSRTGGGLPRDGGMARLFETGCGVLGRPGVPLTWRLRWR
jgi:hypothetical protein